MTRSTANPPRQVGFVLTNHLAGFLTVDGERRDEFTQLRRQGWRIQSIRPICTSMERKFIRQKDWVPGATAYQYSLCILQEPSDAGMDS